MNRKTPDLDWKVSEGREEGKKILAAILFEYDNLKKLNDEIVSLP